MIARYGIKRGERYKENPRARKNVRAPVAELKDGERQPYEGIGRRTHRNLAMWAPLPKPKKKILIPVEEPVFAE